MSASSKDKMTRSIIICVGKRIGSILLFSPDLPHDESVISRHRRPHRLVDEI